MPPETRSDKGITPGAKIALDSRHPPLVRAQRLLMSHEDTPMDLLPPFVQVLQAADALREERDALLREKAERDESEQAPLVPEIFVGWDDSAIGRRAVLLGTGGFLLCPAAVELEGVRRGDYVYVERSSGRVVAHNGHIAPVGEVARIEETEAGHPDQLVVSLRDERFTAYVSDAARESGGLKVGARVIYDAQRRFVHRVLSEQADGRDLLTPASALSEATLDDLGAPNDVVFQILRLVKRGLNHPDWGTTMRERFRRSFLFFGPTGVGKTFTIKVIVNAVADTIEALTGVREPRVVFCDASDFYSPYFGEAEQRVSRWFARLGAVARRQVTTRDGRSVSLPLLVVFEEIDALLRQRGEAGGSSHLFDRVLNLILQKTDAATNELDAPIIFIATTNKKELVDFAARRRFADREVTFGTLDAAAALDVLGRKIPDEVPVMPRNGEPPAEARRALFQSAIHYLFADHADQVVAEVVLRNSQRRPVCMRDLVTGSILESATSQAIDDSLDRSTDQDRLLGLDRAAFLHGLACQFEAVATSLRPHNLRDYAPHLFDEEDMEIVSVRPRPRGRFQPDAHFAA
jgi:ATP-dependent 26S proteasome regulatory subunit